MSGLVLIVFTFWFNTFHCETTETVSTEPTTVIPDTTTITARNLVTETTTLGSEGHAYIDMEIINIEVLPKLGNVVMVFWGKSLREYNLDWTYGVYYGSTVDEALREPKLTTKDLYAEVGNLTFCQQYVFAVGVVNSNKNIPHPQRNIRTLGTLVDELSPPQDLRVEFIPGEEPCLLIKWSASCPNIAVPLGYSISVYEKNPARVTIITVPRSTFSDLSQTLRVLYGKSYDVKVATDVVGSSSTPTVSHKVPNFLQPYKVQLSAQPDGTYVMYWREPYVPYYVGPFYYEVYVYPGRRLTQKYQSFQSNKPIFTFKGNETEYTFMVGLLSNDGAFKSYLTDPMVMSVDGVGATLNVN